MIAGQPESTPNEHAARQAELYRSIWDADPSYGTRIPDVFDTVEHRIAPHIRRIRRDKLPRVIDFGAGDGRFLRVMHHLGLITAGIGVDLHRPEKLPHWMQWCQQPLWEATGVVADYAISADTLEHMPPELVPATLRAIRAAAPNGFLRISNRQDIYGTERGLRLHETVEPPEWWLARLNEAGFEPSSWRIYPRHAMEVWY